MCLFNLGLAFIQAWFPSASDLDMPSGGLVSVCYTSNTYHTCGFLGKHVVVMPFSFCHLLM